MSINESYDSDIEIPLGQVPNDLEIDNPLVYDYLLDLHATIEILTQELNDLKDKVWTHHP